MTAKEHVTITQAATLARDELGISEAVTAHPIHAALVSAATFGVGAVIPLMIAALVPAAQITIIVAVTTLVALSVLGDSGPQPEVRASSREPFASPSGARLPWPRQPPWGWFLASRCKCTSTLRAVDRVVLGHIWRCA